MKLGRQRNYHKGQAKCLNSFLNVKAVVGAFNQEKALVGAFYMIVQLHRLIVYSTTHFATV